MATASSIIVLGSINTDLVIRSQRLPAPGETVIGGEFYRAAGGKGANQAVAAARAARDRVTFIGAVGDDQFGRESLAGFANENLDCQFIKVYAQTASGVALILVNHQGQNLISVASGANACLSPDDVAAIPQEVFDRAKIFLTCLETPIPTVVAALQRAKAAGLTTILNPAPASPELARTDCLSFVDLATPNAGEAALLAGISQIGAVTDDPAIASLAARRIQERGCKNVIVTLGNQGCLVVVDKEEQFIPAHQVTAVDATAAGDAFNGALAVALADGKSLFDAARWAGIAAAISVTRRGAQPSLATRDEIERNGELLWPT